MKEICIFKDMFYHRMGRGYFRNDTFVISQYEFKV